MFTGDEGYPTSGPSPSAHPTTSTVTQTISTSSVHLTPTSTPAPPTSAPTIITTTATSEEPTVVTSSSSTTCKDDSGVEQSDGASWCPTPNVKATCHSGVVSFTENHHCPTLSCLDPQWTAGSCDCPVCPGEPPFLLFPLSSTSIPPSWTHWPHSLLQFH